MIGAGWGEVLSIVQVGALGVAGACFWCAFIRAAHERTGQLGSVKKPPLPKTVLSRGAWGS